MTPALKVLGSIEYAFAFGRLVCLAREAVGLTQVELGQRAGITQPTLSRAERGDVLPDVFVARSLAAALGVTLGQLDALVQDAWRLATDAADSAALKVLVGATVGSDSELRAVRIELIQLALRSRVKALWRPLVPAEGTE